MCLGTIVFMAFFIDKAMMILEETPEDGFLFTTAFLVIGGTITSVCLVGFVVTLLLGREHDTKIDVQRGAKRRNKNIERLNK